MATANDGATTGVRGLAEQANPAFAAGAVAVPIVALLGAVLVDRMRALVYVHVMAGVLWTGIDLFIGMVVGPVLGGLEPEQRAGFFRRFTPKMTFLMPVLALVTISAGIHLARTYYPFLGNLDPWLALMTAAILLPVVVSIGYQFDALTSPRTLGALAVVVVGSGAGIALTVGSLAMINPWLLAALAVVTLLSIQGFGIILPGEIRIYRQITSDEPDVDVISEIGMRNARLGGIQGLLQLSIVFVMVGIRFGG
jgi:hypothetical protein